MTRRRVEMPLANYLLRMKEVRTETASLRYELVDLRAGVTHEFDSLTQLQTYLGRKPWVHRRRRP